VGTTTELEQLERAFLSLEELAFAESGQTLDDLLAETSRSQDEKLWRIGRLMGITIKEPFAYPTEIDPATSETGARRGWNPRSRSVRQVSRAHMAVRAAPRSRR